MCSTPPARITSAIPAWIIAIPEMHTRLIVTAGVVSGMPANRGPTQATLQVSADSMRQPDRTSSMSCGSIAIRFTASLMVALANDTALVFNKVSPKAPIAVLQAATITTFFE